MLLAVSSFLVVVHGAAFQEPFPVEVRAYRLASGEPCGIEIYKEKEWKELSVLKTNLMRLTVRPFL